MTDDDLLAKLITLLAERRLPPDTPVNKLREAMNLAVTKTPLADDVTITPLLLAERACEQFTPHTDKPQKTLLYFHGGGYVSGSLASIRPMASWLAAATQHTVITLDYRLAPEHPFPAARDDAIRAYAELCGLPLMSAATIVLAGDSAGGGLVLATLLALRDGGHVPPLAGVCLSPWTDMSLNAASLVRNELRDPQISRAGLSVMAAHYLAGTDPTDPGVSPRFGDFTGVSPLLIHVGDAEGLFDDSQNVADQARQSGVAVTLDVWPQMIHVWHAFAPRFPPAMAALDRIGSWLDALEPNGS